ncbi:MAG TPA: hypothetical protein VFV96_15960 [Verrucomicrobiae bacterium]|nr:hypothetical protein [Verrucomicrobiae bacterium]
MSDDAHDKAFFRQSGWLMISGIMSGILMMGVHLLSKKIPTAEYGTVVKMLAVTIIIPTMPLQMVFARETAAALALGKNRPLAGLIQKTVLIMSGLWLMAALVGLAFQQSILMHWNVAQASALWLLMLVVWASLVAPVFMGTLQGAQNFPWLGGVMILNGGVRLAGAALLVFCFTGTAAGVMTGVLAGVGASVLLGVWQTRRLWAATAEAFAWRPLLKQAIPLLIGFSAYQFLFSADTIFVGGFFSGDETGYYGAAGTLARALIWLVAPLATVMFPKLVQSTAKAQRNNLLGLTLLGTAILGLGGALGLVLVGPLVVKMVFTSNYVAAVTRIIPWYAGAMIPLSLANVLVNNLLARSDFRVVPWLALLAIGYTIVLNAWHPSLTAVLQCMAGFNAITFLICSLYTWGPLAKKYQISLAQLPLAE